VPFLETRSGQSGGEVRGVEM